MSNGTTAVTFDTGDTSFILVSTALVMIMIPGLAFFYAGMVHRKNVVATMYQSMITLGIVMIQWWFWGYSLGT
jgi:Amt family ammonium transporter